MMDVMVVAVFFGQFLLEQPQFDLVTGGGGSGAPGVCCANGPGGGSGSYATKTIFEHCNPSSGSSRYTVALVDLVIALAVVTLMLITAAAQKDVLRQSCRWWCRWNG